MPGDFPSPPRREREKKIAQAFLHTFRIFAHSAGGSVRRQRHTASTPVRPSLSLTKEREGGGGHFTTYNMKVRGLRGRN